MNSYEILDHSSVSQSLRRIGVFPGNRGDIEKYELDLGVKFQQRLLFQNIYSLNYNQVRYYLDQGYDVILNVEFWNGINYFPCLKDIVVGKFDSYLHSLRKIIQMDGRRVALRPLHEFNGNWYQWGVLYKEDSQTIEDFIKAWKKVSSIFRDTNVEFQLNYNINNGFRRNIPWEAFYPGDEYVDKIVITCYNRAGTTVHHKVWQEFEETFSLGYSNLLGFANKPIGVAEMSTTSNLKGNKPEWILNAFKALADKFPKVNEITWFLLNKKVSDSEYRDWDLNSLEDVEAFKLGYKYLVSKGSS